MKNKMPRFKVGDIINYSIDKACFSYAKGKYVIIETRISRFSDNNEEFQDIVAVPIGCNDCSPYHFCDSLINPNPYLSKVSIE